MCGVVDGGVGLIGVGGEEGEVGGARTSRRRRKERRRGDVWDDDFVCGDEYEEGGER